MSVEQERALREMLEEHLGRRLSDADWELFKRGQMPSAQQLSSAQTHERPRGLLERIARGVAEFTGLLIAMAIVSFVVGIAGTALLLGLGWAYSPDTLDEEWNGIGSFFGAAVVVGFWCWVFWTWSSRVTEVVLALAFVVGTVALAVGALIRLAG